MSTDYLDSLTKLNLLSKLTPQLVQQTHLHDMIVPPYNKLIINLLLLFSVTFHNLCTHLYMKIHAGHRQKYIHDIYTLLTLPQSAAICDWRNARGGKHEFDRRMVTAL